MPGIVGLITGIPREQAVGQLRQMMAALCHEPIYNNGIWLDEELGIYVGWVARAGSFCDGMPLRNENGDVVLTFSGEEYSVPGTARRLSQLGHSLDLGGAAYLVHQYEEDPGFPAGLNGRFHGLLADRARRTATVFNDRYGMHRLYYHESADAFYFAPEAKAILAVRPELRTADPQGLGEFVACGCVLEDRTIFKDIYALPAGSAWVFENGTARTKGRYFHPREWEGQDALAPEAYYTELREAFSRNLPRYFCGGEKIGVSLTGGLDTRVIMAWREAEPKSLPCYTFGGMFRDCEDVILARRVAEACGQSHQVIPVGEDFLANFPHYAERSIYLTEGGADVYRTSDLYVSEKAREIAPAKIVGTYGSEILRHAVMFKPTTPTAGLYGPEILSQVDRARSTYAQLRTEHPVTFAAFRQSPWYHHGILALEQTHLTVRSPYLDNDVVRTVYRAPKSDSSSADVRLRLIRDGNPTLGRIRTDRGIGGRFGSLVEAITHSYLEFTFKAEYAYDYGMPQWVAGVDHFLSPLHLERLFLGRHKMLHFRVWYRDWLGEYLRTVMLDPLALSRPYLDRKQVELIVNGHLRGNRNYTTELHRLLTLELLHRCFFDPR
jgi:asparagine synthase (glutamine-hydrolysing)